MANAISTTTATTTLSQRGVMIAYRAAIASAQATLRSAQALNRSSNAVDFYINAIAARETFNAAEDAAYAEFSAVS